MCRKCASFGIPQFPSTFYVNAVYFKRLKTKLTFTSKTKKHKED